jgi:hypothetical protein
MSLKNFSIRRLATLAAGAVLAAGVGSAAILGAAALPAPASAQSAQSAQSGARATPPIELAPDAPDKHVVVRGDTLWDISATFLKAPWRWPEVWQLNREQIANPHLIYPGDVVYLDRTGAAPRLRLGRSIAAAPAGAGTADGTTRLQPTIRIEQSDRDAISTISPAAIAAFINRPLIVDEKGLAAAPRIIATQEGRVNLGRGDRAYVRGMKEDGVTDWQVYRPARPLVDPDTRQPLAYEALYLGDAQIIRKGDPATIRIIGSAEEIGEGDRLVPAGSDRMLNFVPRPPERDVAGKIVSVYRGVSQVGKNNVVALNIGRNQGIEEGHVLTVQLTGKLAKDRQANELVKLPNEPIGQLLVFRTFDNIAYGLIVDASQPISVGDSVVNP